jgi:hypothetical protein
MKIFPESISDEFRIQWYDLLLMFTIVLLFSMAYHMMIQMPALEEKYKKENDDSSD